MTRIGYGFGMHPPAGSLFDRPGDFDIGAEAVVGGGRVLAVEAIGDSGSACGTPRTGGSFENSGMPGWNS